MADPVLGLVFIPGADIGPDPNGDGPNVGDGLGNDSQAVVENSLAIPRVLGGRWQGADGASRLLHESCRVVAASISSMTKKAEKIYPFRLAESRNPVVAAEGVPLHS
jgi:hypothetical protein